ncbi:MAG TPA: type II toxin-antitoxin system HicA family toxin [Terriglobia bacterium]|nr:type II toxin-antitoxin system HicA family toxin [Terriglobia bacterium]
MARLPRITAKKVLRALLKAGFYIHHQTGSHVNLRHHTRLHLHVVIPRHGGDLAPKTLKSIIAQAESSVEEFSQLMS